MDKAQILALMVDDVAVGKKAIGDYLRNKDNSFEDRKEVFLATPKHLYSKEPWILHLSTFDGKYGEINWFDDFFAERYTDVDLVKKILEAEIDPDYGFFTSQEKYDDFVKEVVDNGKHSFYLDW
jgi:hypothetical protein